MADTHPTPLVRALLLGTAALTAAVAVGCGLVTGVHGEGPSTAESREVTGFSRIEASHGIGVTVTVGPVQAVTVHAQQNLLPIIETRTSDSTLRIRATDELAAGSDVEVAIVTPSLDAISLSGGSQGDVNAVDAARLDVQLGGGAVLTASGTADEVSISSTGGSQVHLVGIAARRVSLELSGGSLAEVTASDEVVGSASGGAHATVHGSARLDVSASGGAEVSRG